MQNHPDSAAIRAAHVNLSVAKHLAGAFELLRTAAAHVREFFQVEHLGLGHSAYQRSRDRAIKSLNASRETFLLAKQTISELPSPAD